MNTAPATAFGNSQQESGFSALLEIFIQITDFKLSDLLGSKGAVSPGLERGTNAASVDG